MKRKHILPLLLSTSAVFAALGFNAYEKSSPRDLGFHRAKLDDRGLLEMAVDQMLQGSPSGRPELIRLDDKQALIRTNLRSAEVNLVFEKRGAQWRLAESSRLRANSPKQAPLAKADYAEEIEVNGLSLYREDSHNGGKTLLQRAVSPELGIERLTRKVTEEKLDRQLFQKPYAGVLVSTVTQLNEAPFFAARYVQVTTDPAWNRLVYGDYAGWIKAYGNTGDSQADLNRPHGIDRDAEDHIYVADTGNHRIVVLRFEGSGPETQLKYHFAFGVEQLVHPYDVAWDDAGTPFESSDDLIWVTDTGHNRIVAFELKNKTASVRYVYDASGSGTGSFLAPKAIAVGRFNGSCNGLLYVADTGNRRIVKLAVEDDQVRWQGVFEGKAESQYTSLDTDHWGNVYLSDRSYGEIAKLSSDLEPLAVLTGAEALLDSPMNFHVTFGRVNLANGEQNWAGYDQAFLLERWSEKSGARRFQLGLDLTDFAVELSESFDHLRVNSKLTDNASVSLTVRGASGRVVRQTPLGWRVPGQKQFVWDRRDDAGFQVASGYYSLELSAKSSYGDLSVLKETPDFYLPLYYSEDSGADPHSDPHLAQGTRSADWGDEPHETVVRHPKEIVYRFEDLNPTLEYEVRAQFYIAEARHLVQMIRVDGVSLVDGIEVSQEVLTLDWVKISQQLHADCELEVTILKSSGEGDAVVSQLWLREANYDPANPPVMNGDPFLVPETFTLSQNYPNPFNPSTTIEFGVPAENFQKVALRVLNVIGQTVKVLVDETLPGGLHSVVWDGRDSSGRLIASGVYFYELRIGDPQTGSNQRVVETRKLVLMK